MIRAVIDTNVVVSALISKKPSAPLQIYKAFTSQHFLLITSPTILEEVEDVINRVSIVKFHRLSISKRQGILKEFITLSYIVPEGLISKKILVEADPKDDKFLTAAREGKADYIVSGDHHLLNFKEYDGIKIITPKEFLEVIGKEKHE